MFLQTLLLQHLLSPLSWPLLVPAGLVLRSHPPYILGCPPWHTACPEYLPKRWVCFKFPRVTQTEVRSNSQCIFAPGDQQAHLVPFPFAQEGVLNLDRSAFSSYFFTRAGPGSAPSPPPGTMPGRCSANINGLKE